jgi:GNAT superfamily N-acetyltransferase/predicted transcriptional regulator
MRARDFITELFRPGQDINFKWSRPYQDEVNVLGKTPQGHELSINFWEITDDIVAIDFTIDADVEQDPDPDSSPKSGHELTRHGEEFAVFTQVVNAITQYLNKLPKNNVFFQVKRTEAQREPLYLKIANRVAKQLGFRHGTAQELEATNPGLYNKFDNRYSKLLWYTNAPQGIAEGNEINRAVEDLVQQVDFVDIVYKIARQKYPQAKFEKLDDMRIQVDVSGENNDPFDYKNYQGFFVMGMTYSNDEGTEVGVLISDAYSGPYKGIILPAIKLATEKCLQLVPNATPTLWVDDDESGGIWNEIAKKLGYKFEILNEGKQGVAENFADGRKFVEPNFDFEWEEAERYPEFVKLGKDAWIELARKGKAVTINSAQGINNTDAADPDSFKLLAPEKQKRALAQLEKGTVEMPIVAVYSDGQKELIGGNTRLTAMMARDGKATIWAFRVPGKQGVAEGQDDNGISFQVQKGKNKFATTLSIGNKPVGVYQYDADTGRSIAEVYPEFKGKGLGKLLVLHAIYTAAQLGLDFQEDESRTAEYDNVLDSLSSNGYIVDDDGYWYVTGEGEQYLQQSMKQGVAEGESNTTPTIGINVRSDGDIDYAGLIVDGRKKYESRKTDSLGPYVGKTVGIVRTGTGPAVAIGQVTVGEPIVVDAEKFNSLRKQHLVPQGSKFDIDVDGIKYLYPMIDPVRWDNERPVKQRGIVARKIQEQDVAENFKDGKNPGRKGLSKRMGVNTKASVSALRKVAKNSSGEKQRMAHWLANMKSGRKKS